MERQDRDHTDAAQERPTGAARDAEHPAPMIDPRPPAPPPGPGLENRAKEIMDRIGRDFRNSLNRDAEADETE